MSASTSNSSPINTPVVLSYFSQSGDPNDPYLDFLQDEYRAITDSWEKYQQTASPKSINVLYPARGAADARQIDDDIRAFKHRIILFHFSGHAGSQHLLFKDGSAYAKGLAGLLGEAQNLKVVFLNGCATHDQVNLLFEKNVKAVIATRGKINDGVAKEFSENFYEAVSSIDYTIREAFEHAVNTMIKDGRIAPETSTALISWRGIVTESSDDKDRWELFVREGFSDLDSKDWWKIGVITAGRKELISGGSLWDRGQIWLSALLFALGLAIIAYGIFFQNDIKVAGIGVASCCVGIFGFKNQQRYVTAELNPELVDDSMRKKLRLL